VNLLLNVWGSGAKAGTRQWDGTTVAVAGKPRRVGQASRLSQLSHDVVPAVLFPDLKLEATPQGGEAKLETGATPVLRYGSGAFDAIERQYGCNGRRAGVGCEVRFQTELRLGYDSE
jgi:hypothetical protein